MSNQNMHRLIEQLRELISKATPGPWCCCSSGHMECREIGNIGHLEIHSPSSPFQRAESEHDARLLVAAVNALPALLAIAEAAGNVIESRYYPQYDMTEKLDALECATIDLRIMWANETAEETLTFEVKDDK